MFPSLISFGPIQISTLSVFAAMGMISALFLIWRRAHEEHYDDDEVFDVVLQALIGGWVAARIFHVLFFFNDFGLDPQAWLSLSSRPGLSELAGVLVGLYLTWLFAKRRKWNAFDMTDFVAVGMTLWLIFVWIGRFFAGSFAGTVTTLPIGLTFPGVFDKLHPVQLYFAVLFILLYIFLRWAEKRYRFFLWYRGSRHAANAGFITSAFLIGYSFIYLLLSPFYIHQIVVMGVRLDLLFMIITLLTGIVMMMNRSGKQWLPRRRRR